MKKLLLLALLCSPACAHTPPNLTPQAVVAFRGTQVIGYLDKVRDAADAAHHTTPPLLSAKTTLQIVNWHQAAITVVHDAKDGWQAAVLSGLAGLKAQLTADEQQTVGPYIDAARIILASVTQ